MEKVVPKIARQRGSDTGQSRRRWVRSCRGCPQALQEEFSWIIIEHSPCMSVGFVVNDIFKWASVYCTRKNSTTI